jgi:hypothetical protein
VSLWFFGGLRDFRWDRDLPWLHARDTAPATADTTPRAEPAESIASVSPGSTTVAGETARPRRAAAPRKPVADPLPRGRGALPDTGPVIGDDTAAASSPIEPEPAAESAFPDPSAYVPLQRNPDGEEPDEDTAPPRRVSPPAPRPKPAPPVDRRQLESRMRDGVNDCYGAVRSKNWERLAEMYHPRTYADDDKLTRLTRILRTEPWHAVVGRRVDGVHEMSADAAAAEFSFRLDWRGSHGGRLSSHPIFRAEFARDTSGWTMSSCRIVGSPKL